MDTVFFTRKLWKSHLEYLEYEIHYRNQFRKKIFEICKQEGLEIYGSFLTGNFHLDIASKYSLSDIDAISKNILDKEKTSNFLSKKIRLETGICLPINIRTKKLALCKLNEEQSNFVSAIDTLLKILSSNSESIKQYQVSKFFLRTIYKHNFYTKNILLKSCENNLYIWNLIEVKTNGAFILPKTMIWLSDEFKSAKLYNEFNLILNIKSTNQLSEFWETNKYILKKYPSILSDLQNKINVRTNVI